ncbi:MAG: proline dehydrogenase family protein, partial [Alphaproteobacteria bacterium]
MTETARFIGDLPTFDPLREAINAAYRMDETASVDRLLAAAEMPRDLRARITRRARNLVTFARKRQAEAGGLDAFLGEYALSSSEGLVLMCLAEALLRIPDSETADRLIRDKLAAADWEHHLGRSHSVFVNASTIGLLLTGRVVAMEHGAHDLGGYLGRLVARAGEPVIRAALIQAMRIMGHQFVKGRTIREALADAASSADEGYRHSFDMLGEAAYTARDAERYYDAYVDAIAALKPVAAGRSVIDAPGVSVKLSALHPRFEFSQRGRVLRELVPRLSELVALARDAGIGFTVDSEEADRLDLSLDVFEAVFAEPGFGDWDGFGFALQAYQKRAGAVIDWFEALSRRHHRRIMLRLVKGAYWDSEIKHAQELGLDGYPVFTRKASTDVSYIACVRQLFAAPLAFYPQFASHNAHTIASVQELAPDGAAFEFQRLHGMGEELFDAMVRPRRGPPVNCRIYAPVGSHEDLLPYLVRRLLENGANSSFVNRLADETLPVSRIIADPVARTASLEQKPHPGICLPADLYAPERRAARGLDLTDPGALASLAG